MPWIGYAFLLLGVLSLANGAWMTISPESWYHEVPAEVSDTGAYNAHFIRDIGLAYAISGLGFVWAAFNLAKCYIIHLGQVLFVGGHAFLHVLDVLFGRLPHTHWWIDAPGVFLPAVIVSALAIPRIWRWANPAAASPPLEGQ